MALNFVSIQPVSVLFGAINPFTFKVIINMYVPMVNLLIFFWSIFVSLYHSLIFFSLFLGVLFREVPLEIVVNCFSGAEFS